jgi:small basic protein (TIGR04137 family)
LCRLNAAPGPDGHHFLVAAAFAKNAGRVVIAHFLSNVATSERLSGISGIRQENPGAIFGCFAAPNPLNCSIPLPGGPRSERLAVQGRIRAGLFTAGDFDVAIDKSLRRKGRLVRSRNVLNREERINQMKAEETWVAGRGALGLPKTRVMKIAAKKKKKVKEEGAEGAAPAAGKAAAPAAKPAAKGGKG